VSSDDLDIKDIQERVRRGDYLVKNHAMMHVLKEGFTIPDIVEAVLNGNIIEEYPDDWRVLICGQAFLTDQVRIYLHIVCEYTDPIYVEFITAYIPDELLWQNPPFVRRKPKK
jgi:hypothetical protein